MPRRKPFRPANLLDRLLPATPAILTTNVVEPPYIVRGRAIDVLSSMPSRYITTKSVLDTYLDAIGVGR
jgi:hypothetical protein